VNLEGEAARVSGGLSRKCPRRVSRARGRAVPSTWAGTAEIVRLALNRAGIEGYVRPRHDLRHSSITNAAAGMPPEALMTRAGHSSYTRT
jgi:integrase